MKSARNKNTSTPNLQQKSKAREPFFGEERKGVFFPELQPKMDFFFSPPTVQTKLTTEQPNDNKEQEADATVGEMGNQIKSPSQNLSDLSAPKVMRQALDNIIQLSPELRNIPDAIDQILAGQEEEEENLQRDSVHHPAVQAGRVPVNFRNMIWDIFKAIHWSEDFLETSRFWANLAVRRLQNNLAAFDDVPEVDGNTLMQRLIRELGRASSVNLARDQRRGRRIRERFEGNGYRVVNEEPAVSLAIHGIQVQVHGASQDELNSIQDTLSLLPISNLSTLPHIVVANNISHGERKTTGGGSIPVARAEFLSRSPAFRRARAILGWRQIPRIELSRGSYSIAADRAEDRNDRDIAHGRTPIPGQIWDTLIHETGHSVASTYDLSGFINLERLRNICYRGANSSSSCGGAWERFADAYMHYYTQPHRLGSSAQSTIEESLAAIEEQYIESTVEVA